MYQSGREGRVGKGSPGMMKASNDCLEWLEQNQIKVIEEATVEAVKTFNRLSKEGKNVAAGLHLTC